MMNSSHLLRFMDEQVWGVAPSDRDRLRYRNKTCAIKFEKSIAKLRYMQHYYISFKAPGLERCNYFPGEFEGLTPQRSTAKKYGIYVQHPTTVHFYIGN